jgi:hypothetical protein
MLLASIWLFPLIRWYSYYVGRPLASADLRFSSLLHFRQYLSSNLHFRQFNGSKTRIVDKVEMRNLSVLIELAAKNWFQPRQRIGSSHKSRELRSYEGGKFCLSSTCELLEVVDHSARSFT